MSPPPVPSSLPPAVLAVIDELRHAGLSDAWVKDTLAFVAMTGQWPPDGLSTPEHEAGNAVLLDLAETISWRHERVLDAMAQLGNAGLQALAVANGIADQPAYRTLLHMAEPNGGLADFFVTRTGPVAAAAETGDTILHQNLLAMVDPVAESSADACALCLAQLPVDLLTPGLGSVMVFVHLGCAAAACAASA